MPAEESTLPEHLAAHEKKLKAASDRSAMAQSAAILRESMEARKQRISQLISQEADISLLLHSARLLEARLTEQQNAYQSSIKAWETYLLAAGRADDLDKSIDILKSRPVTLPERPAGYIPLSDEHVWRGELEALMTIEADHRLFLSTVRPGMSTCPICKQSAPGLEREIPERRADQKSLGEMTAALRALWDLSRRHDSDMERALAQQRVLQQALERDTAQRDQLRAVPRPEGERPRSVHMELSNAVSDRSALESGLLRCVADREACERGYAESEQELGEVEESLQSSPEISPEELASGRLELEAWQARRERKLSITQERASLLRQIADLERRQADEESSARVFARIEQHRGALQRVSQAFSRTGVPFETAGDYLEDLEPAVNSCLAAFKADFDCKVDRQTLDYVCNIGGESLPGKRLSGGQGCLLTLAFFLSVATRWGPGVLCLDEPTAGMDRRRVESMRDALANLRSGGSPVQILVVTHERSLLPSFDKVVELS